jgi:hypothetical protein
MKVSSSKSETQQLKEDIGRYEALASQEYCKNRANYVYLMWSATHKFLRITNPNSSTVEYSDKAPYPALEGDDITIGDVIL